MTNTEREKLKNKQIKLMEKREQLEALQMQRSDRLEYVRCLDGKMQALDEQSDRIEWILQNGGET